MGKVHSVKGWTMVYLLRLLLMDTWVPILLLFAMPWMNHFVPMVFCS